MDKHYNLKNIRPLLTQGFTAEELRRFCHDELDFKPVYHKLAENTGKATIIDWLLEYANQKSKIEALLMWAKEHNSAKYEIYQPYYDIITSPTISSDNADYQAALNRYLVWLCRETEWIVLHGIQRAEMPVRLRLDQVYVPLTAEVLLEGHEQLEQELLTRGSEAEEMTETAKKPQHISMQELLAQGSKLAVTGAPGCGKTIVLYHIAWILAETLRTNQLQLAADRLGFTEELPVPVIIPLSLYDEYRREKNRDPESRHMDAFIAEYLKEHITGLPENFFSMLQASRQPIILLLDGLDEVPNENDRIIISRVVRDLTSAWSNFRFVVTCRTQAYQDRVVLPDFRVIRMLPLAQEQIQQLIKQVYEAVLRKETQKREELINDLINGITKLEDERAIRLGNDEVFRLVNSPLIVRMLLIVHYNSDRQLPNQRAELYSKVVETILKADYNPNNEAIVQGMAKDWKDRLKLFQYLAFEMHSQGQDAGGKIHEQNLLKKLQDYLREQNYKSRKEAETEAAEFVALNRQRGGLLEERAEYYRFSHLSFQEFLTACYLVDIYEGDIDSIVQYIEDKRLAASSWWREPILLIVGYLKSRSEENATKLITRMAYLDNTIPAPPQNGLALAAAELAAGAFLEWGEPDTTQAKLARRLAKLLSNSKLMDAPPYLRAAAGRALAHLGDPRPGVGLHNNSHLPHIEWVSIPAGPFLMGSREEEEERGSTQETPQHQIHLPSFKISKYPITNTQYQAFVDDGGYQEASYWPEADAAGCWCKGQIQRVLFKKGEDGAIQAVEEWVEARLIYDSPFNLPNHPVVGVNWYEAIAFCRWLTVRLSQNARWLKDEVIMAEGERVFWEELAEERLEVMLPSEAEWEKAARSGDGRIYSWGDQANVARANYNDTEIGSTSAVGCFPGGASPYGCQDMIGNVWEWTRSLLGEAFGSQNFNYPYFPEDGREDLKAGDEILRVLRGGSFLNYLVEARCSVRRGLLPDSESNFIGFRIVVGTE